MSENFKNIEQQNLPETGLLRLKQVLQFIPVSRSTWLATLWGWPQRRLTLNSHRQSSNNDQNLVCFVSIILLGDGGKAFGD